ncbi:MAG TPA: hypothetical protein VM617_02735, partial [Thermoanaerobaculia bacterium]|nr:hypothetical protein [Thermoanaerobaculia bacterium]
MRHRCRKPRRLLRATNTFAAAAAVTAVALLLSPAAADDRDLLRFDSAKPYLFIVLDTSASMGMKMGVDEWAPGGADGPDSRFYQSKQALFNVIRDIDDVHFGFAGYNQNDARAVAKHWLYYNEQPLPTASEWPIEFPKPDLVDVDENGSVLTQLIAIPPVDEDGNEIPLTSVQIKDTRVSEIGGDLITFGPRLDAPAPDGSGRVIAGTCASPLDLAVPTQRAAVQSLPVSGSGAKTWFWVRNGSDTTYLLTIERPGNRPEKDGVEPPNSKVGEDLLNTIFQLKKVASGNNSCGTVDTAVFDSGFGSSGTRTLRIDLRQDPLLSQFFHVNHPNWAESQGTESALAFWHGKDVRSLTSFESHPHTGFGWEGNYDSGLITEDVEFNAGVTEDDFHCPPSSSCAPYVKHITDTVVDGRGLGRAYDLGDVIPFDWDRRHRNELLRRLDPEFDPDFSTLGDFRIARHFGSTLVDGALPRLVSTRVPLVAADLSPLARALTDVRCWYLGSSGQGGNKCKETQTIFSGGRFADAWSEVACAKDSSFGCRRNFLIVISDGEDNVAGQNASGSVGNLKNSANMVTWALNVGHPSGCDDSSQSELKSIVTAGGGECVNVPTQAQLRQALEALLGQIRTTARSFASAAVPSVQATVEQKIFLTSFLPFNETSVWKGSVHAFVKPLPVSPAGIPLTEKKCDGSGAISVDDPTQGCHLWDAGQLLFDKQYPAMGDDYLALDDVALRRVFYARQMEGTGEWPRNMRLFDPVLVETENSQPVRFDLWRGMRIPFETDETDPTVNAGPEKAEGKANAVVDYVLRFKEGIERNTDVDPPLETVHTFLMGDVFHSTPVVIGTPSNSLFFATDLYNNGAECDENDGTAAANPGYRCFFQKQQFRRKMLLVGSNDGMLHAFDAGMFRTNGGASDHWTGVELTDEVTSPFGSFDNGTGKELFAYVPRMVLPTLKDMSLSTQHRYNVDGTATVADIFIDPVKEGTTTFPLAADREWRTVVVGGLREGGRGYYGLDITQPDPVVAHGDLDFVPETADSGSNHPDSGAFVPVCTATLTETAGTAGMIAPSSEPGCGPTPFPAVLWEFTDSHYDDLTGRLWYADEDRRIVDGVEEVTGNDRPDLGDTWSTPNIGRIRLCRTGGSACDPTPDEEGDDADLVDVFVAVVGGGMDTVNKTHDWRTGPPEDKLLPEKAAGNWLYMIDLETGEAIYKQQLEGAAPSEPAAVDTDGDGYLDRIYIGT